MTDLTVSCMMGQGSLPQPGPSGASPASHGAAQDGVVLHSPQNSAALLSGGMLRDQGLLGGCCSQLNQDEVVCPHLGFDRGDGKLVA